MAGLRPQDHPVLRKFSSGELDEERKQELIMEKKLRVEAFDDVFISNSSIILYGLIL